VDDLLGDRTSTAKGPTDGNGMAGPSKSPSAESQPSTDQPSSQSDTRRAATKPAYQVLARKYRPTTFKDLIGQDALVRTLTNALVSGRMAQAYMLTGVRGVGKTTSARIIARALNCIGPDGQGGPTAEPCGTCTHCTAISQDRHVDVIEMDAASHTGIDDMREVIDGARYAPVSARYKVYIIDEVHMISTKAFNALLKTLEEPPAHVKFIFATTEIRKVPVTILSRCQRFDLRRVDAGTLIAHFTGICVKESVEAEEAAIALIARAADGSVRDGLSLLDQAIALSSSTVTQLQVRDMLGLADREQIVDLFEATVSGRPADALGLYDHLHRSGADPVAVLKDLLDVCHMLTRFKVVPEAAEDLGLGDADRRRGADLADKLSIPQLTRLWQMLLKGQADLSLAPDADQAMEMVLIRIAHASRLPLPGDLIRALEGGGFDVQGGASRPTGAQGGGGGGAHSGTGSSGASGHEPARSEAAGGNGAARGRQASPQGMPGDPGGPPRAMGENPGGLALVPTVAPPDTASEPMQAAELDPAEARCPMPRSFLELVALFGQRREGELYANLYGAAHLVHFAPGRLEIRLESAAPRDLANRVTRLLSEWTGQRWIVTLTNQSGAPTLAEQERAAEAETRDQASRHPVVQALLETFPGARITAVRDLTPPAEAAPSGDGPENSDASSPWDGTATVSSDEESTDDEEYR